MELPIFTSFEMEW
jgi:hypothetical protein